MKMTDSTVTTRTIDLGRDQLLTIEAPHGRIQVTHGLTWLTEAGGAHDTLLAPGDAWRLTGRPTVLGALATARLEIIGADGADGSALLRAWQRLVRAARRQVQRLQLGPVGIHPWA